MILLLALSACQNAKAPTPTPQPVVAAAQPPTGAEPLVPVGTDAEVQEQLVVWVPVFTGLLTGDTAAGVLENAFRQYELSHASVSLETQVKAESGTASMFQLLRTAQAVAPSVLPDLVLVNTQHLWQLADLALVPPLAAEEVVQMGDFYPFALDAVTYRNEVYGIPYAVDIIHAVTKSRQQELAPESWSELLAQETAYLFPGSSGEGYQFSHALLQYFGAGGELLEDGTITNPEALEAYFEFLAEGRAQGVIPALAADLATFQSVWDIFQDDPDGVAAVQAHNFLQEGRGSGLTFVQVPTRSGPPVTVAETWAFAILTQEPARRVLALDLVEALLAPEVQGAWSQEVDHLPSRRSALAQWSRSDTYLQFLDLQMATAIAIPNGRTFFEFARRLQATQAGILRGDHTAEEASIIMGGG